MSNAINNAIVKTLCHIPLGTDHASLPKVDYDWILRLSTQSRLTKAERAKLQSNPLACRALYAVMFSQACEELQRSAQNEISEIFGTVYLKAAATKLPADFSVFLRQIDPATGERIELAELVFSSDLPNQARIFWEPQALRALEQMGSVRVLFTTPDGQIAIRIEPDQLDDICDADWLLEATPAHFFGDPNHTLTVKTQKLERQQADDDTE